MKQTQQQWYLTCQPKNRCHWFPTNIDKNMRSLSLSSALAFALALALALGLTLPFCEGVYLRSHDRNGHHHHHHHRHLHLKPSSSLTAAKPKIPKKCQGMGTVLLLLVVVLLSSPDGFAFLFHWSWIGVAAGAAAVCCGLTTRFLPCLFSTESPLPKVHVVSIAHLSLPFIHLAIGIVTALRAFPPTGPTSFPIPYCSHSMHSPCFGFHSPKTIP